MPRNYSGSRFENIADGVPKKSGISVNKNKSSEAYIEVFSIIGQMKVNCRTQLRYELCGVLQPSSLGLCLLKFCTYLDSVRKEQSLICGVKNYCDRLRPL